MTKLLFQGLLLKGQLLFRYRFFTQEVLFFSRHCFKTASFSRLTVEVLKRGKITVTNSRDLAVSIFNYGVLKNEHDRMSFKILYLMIHSNKFLKSFKCC